MAAVEANREADSPAPRAGWGPTLIWTAGVALAGAVMRVVARRLTDPGRERPTGESAPPR